MVIETESGEAMGWGGSWQRRMREMEWESPSKCNQNLVTYSELMRFPPPQMKTAASWPTKPGVFDLSHSTMGGSTLKETRLRPPIEYFREGIKGGGNSTQRGMHSTTSNFDLHTAWQKCARQKQHSILNLQSSSRTPAKPMGSPMLLCKETIIKKPIDSIWVTFKAACVLQQLHKMPLTAMPTT